MKLSRKIANYITQEIDNLSEEELEQASVDVDELSKSNCWWLEYDLKNIIETLIENRVLVGKVKKNNEA